jgi:hypothetical protein
MVWSSSRSPTGGKSIPLPASARSARDRVYRGKTCPRYISAGVSPDPGSRSTNSGRNGVIGCDGWRAAYRISSLTQSPNGTARTPNPCARSRPASDPSPAGRGLPRW